MNNLEKSKCCNIRGVIHEENCKERKRLLEKWAKESKLSNLDKIKAAWAMGWSATLKSLNDNGVILVSPNKDWSRIAVRDINDDIHFWHTYHDEESLLITGYLYAGELAGNEIPYGQKFMVKPSGGILSFIEKSNGGVILQNVDTAESFQYDKYEIEPYFE